jgi:nitrate reductase beta subunit
MEGSNHEVQEIVPSVLNRTRCKKYRQKILLEPLDPYVYRHSKRKTVSHHIIDVEDGSTPATTEDISIR